MPHLLIGKGIPSSWAALGPSFDIPPELDITRCMGFLSAQLESCGKTHKNCLPPLSNLPTRVIHVGSGENVRLIESRGRKHRYIALSHCWGNGKGIVTTTTSTVEKHMQQITLSSLPRSFRDAIQITRMLKIEYLWIDSLCIIQDSDQDWKNESIKMADVYSQSYLTIAATGSTTSLEGCLFSRWHETEYGIKIPHSVSAQLEKHAHLPTEVKVRYAIRSHSQLAGETFINMRSAPLLTRAWAFQERVLSTRTLHFHGEEMLWECLECSLCECGYIGWENAVGCAEEHSFHTSIKKPFADVRLGHGTQAQTLKTWLRLVNEFTSLSISSELDRLPAVSGLASCISERLDGPYMAGIWRDDLASGLLWYKRPYQQGRRVHGTEHHYVPTWSWASCELLSSRSAGMSFFHDGMITDSQFQLLSSISSWRKNTTFLLLRDASLQVAGSVISCKLMHRHQQKLDVYPTHTINF